ncbi:MAG: preprotein translocase subunit SecG [Clostridia bacterium]|nr:preprotein translocase subunit SecG [Clostridia bacterium]
MGTLVTVLCVIMIVLAIFLVIAVLMQSGKEPGLSGTVVGAAETFFGKNKGKTVDKALNTATMIVSIIFVVLVLTVYIIQAAESNNKVETESTPSDEPAVTETAQATVDVEDVVETAAPAETAEAATAATETATAEN